MPGPAWKRKLPSAELAELIGAAIKECLERFEIEYKQSQRVYAFEFCGYGETMRRVRPMEKRLLIHKRVFNPLYRGGKGKHYWTFEFDVKYPSFEDPKVDPTEWIGSVIKEDIRGEGIWVPIRRTTRPSS